MIEYDVETTGFQYASGHEAFLFQFFDGKDEECIRRGDKDWRKRVQAWFDRAAVDPQGIRAWNSKFDFHFAKAAGFTLPPKDKWFDGMITAHAVDERRSVALKSVAVELFGPDANEHEKKVKEWLTKERAERKKAAQAAGAELIEPNYSDVPMEIMVPYAMDDVYLTRKISDVYDPIVANSPELAGLVEFEREVMGAMFEVEERGLPADAECYHLLELELVERLEELEDRCVELAGDPEFNPNSSPQVYKALKRRGADMTFVTGESMDKENLETVDDDLARAILAFRSEKKVYSTYVRPMIAKTYDKSMRHWKLPFIAPDGRIHANYRQVGARTGRMSCSDPNMQNQPRDDLRLRYAVRAEEGKLLVCCDLSNIEMRVLAAYAGNGPLLEAVRAGRDLHELTAENLGFRDRKRAEGVYESARQQGKTFNFSKIYGAGVNKIRKSFRVSQADAREFFNRYDDAYPEVRKLGNTIQWKLEDQGYIKSAWGRRYRASDPRKEGYKFLNYLIQGTSADLFKQTIVNLERKGIPVVACVHDEIVAHCDEADAQEVQAEIIHELTNHPRITNLPSGIMPLEAEGKIVKRWSQAKDPDYVPSYATKGKQI